MIDYKISSAWWHLVSWLQMVLIWIGHQGMKAKPPRRRLWRHLCGAASWQRSIYWFCRRGLPAVVEARPTLCSHSPSADDRVGSFNFLKFTLYFVRSSCLDWIWLEVPFFQEPDHWQLLLSSNCEDCFHLLLHSTALLSYRTQCLSEIWNGLDLSCPQLKAPQDLGPGDSREEEEGGHKMPWTWGDAGTPRVRESKQRFWVDNPVPGTHSQRLSPRWLLSVPCYCARSRATKAWTTTARVLRDQTPPPSKKRQSQRRKGEWWNKTDKDHPHVIFLSSFLPAGWHHLVPPSQPPSSEVQPARLAAAAPKNVEETPI